MAIDMKDSNLELICTADFEDEQDYNLSQLKTDPEHIQFFLQYAALSQQTALVLAQLHRISSGQRATGDFESMMGFCGMSLAAWLQNCPSAMQWHVNRHKFLPAILHSFY